MKTEVSELVFRHWEELRKGQLLPTRAGIDPRKLGHALGNTFILEANAPDNIRFRLVGATISDLMGMEMRGMPAYSIVQQNARNQFNQLVQACLTQPEILNLKLSPIAKMILLPMTDEDGAVTRVLGCLNANSSAIAAPVRFDITSFTTTRIIAAQRPVLHVAREFADDKTDFEHPQKKAASSKPPFLKIVK